MLIPHSQIRECLPESSRNIEVLSKGGTLAFVAPVQAVYRLADEKAISGEINPKKGWLRYVILEIGVRQARIITGLTKATASESLPIAEDNFTVTRIKRPSCQYFEFRDKVTIAWPDRLGHVEALQNERP